MIATQSGFGHELIFYENMLQTNMVMALMVSAGIIGFTIDRGMLFLSRRVAKWRYVQAV
jgi:ABC-type nitrate/sulfonate/bicarbonate transport system permease component